ncbi:MAG: hypothetical protein NDF56_06510 [archaeon GB-1845-036]|nr:hypothetical protein [Candidatus Culexmicrobium thermophilum]HDO20721.1 hypothetical protein [Candidatus Bathyarchaeota archaeon]
MASILRSDLFMESASAIISLLVAYYSMKAYKLTENRSLMHLYYGFSILGTGMFVRVFSLIYVVMIMANMGGSRNILGLTYTIGVIYGILRIMAYGFFIIAYTERKKTSTILPAIFPIILNPYFELIEITMLIYVVIQTLINFSEKRNINAMLVLIAFSLLLLSHIAFAFSIINLRFYMVGHILQFTAFLSMLIMLIRIGR